MTPTPFPPGQGLRHSQKPPVMLQGLFYGTELCQFVGGEACRVEFLLTTDLSQHIFKKYQWIAPIIFAQKSGGGAKHKVREKAGFYNGEGDYPTPRAASLEQSFIPKLLFTNPHQPSGCWGVPKRLHQHIGVGLPLLHGKSYGPPSGMHRSSWRRLTDCIPQSCYGMAGAAATKSL